MRKDSEKSRPVASGGRRQPSQARAQLTVEALFKAAAQILDREGESGLTTNKVAARAGFSIGTLYQYFPSKEMLVQAMAMKGKALVIDALEAHFVALEADPAVARMDPRELLRSTARIMIEGFAQGRGFTQTLIRLGWRFEQPEDTASAARKVADRLALFLERIRHPQLQVPTGARLFVLSRAVVGALRSASLEKSPLLGGRELEDALVDIGWALLGRGVQAQALPLGARPIR